MRLSRAVGHGRRNAGSEELPPDRIRPAGLQVVHDDHRVGLHSREFGDEPLGNVGEKTSAIHRLSPRLGSQHATERDRSHHSDPGGLDERSLPHRPLSCRGTGIVVRYSLGLWPSACGPVVRSPVSTSRNILHADCLDGASLGQAGPEPL